jgi:3-oxoacyl-[acyl-carrier-protein] synthase II
MTAPPPDGEGAARAMKLALDHARISPEQVDYINAHATSTDIGDLCETRASRKSLANMRTRFRSVQRNR